MFNARVSYYQWAEQKLNSAQFQTTTDRLIWEFHSTEGLSRREIAPRVGLNSSWVGKKVHKIEEYLKNQVYGFTIGTASFAAA